MGGARRALVTRLRQPSSLPSLLLCVLLLVHVTDFANALLAPRCSTGDPRVPSGLFWSCYPWGWEGPFADHRFWRSKPAYLQCLALQLGICMAGLIASTRIRSVWLGAARCWLALPAQTIVPLTGAGPS